MYGWRKGITIVPAAAGSSVANLNLRNPTVATLSNEIISAAKHDGSWSAERWTHRAIVRQTTLDELIAEHGLPKFIKIDVEGYEAEVLRGLHHHIDALSFEFTNLLPEVALDALGRCEELGRYGYNVAVGESQQFLFPQARTAQQLAQWIRSLPREVNSGDIYAVTKNQFERGGRKIPFERAEAGTP
jgi:hypothetical protein